MKQWEQGNAPQPKVKQRSLDGRHGPRRENIWRGHLANSGTHLRMKSPLIVVFGLLDRIVNAHRVDARHPSLHLKLREVNPGLKVQEIDGPNGEHPACHGCQR